MKLAEFVAKFLESRGIKHVFGVSGGASLHLIHGIADATKIKFIPTCHEQAAGFAADAYARLMGLGCALATSGPGATNLITAIAASFYDSVPTLYITGQVATFRQGSRYGVRAYGFQETPIVEMVRPITKYAKTVENATDILWILEAAIDCAQHGRKGPVLVDIPDDLQRAEIDPDALKGLSWTYPDDKYDFDKEVLSLALEAKRPVFIWGSGMRPHAEKALRLAECLRIPIATTWGAIDLIPYNHPLHIGGFGTHGTRAANFAVQNSDLIIGIGCRLDTKATGTPHDFARAAKIVMVDIDQDEIRKFEKLGRKIDLGIVSDAGVFIDRFYSIAASFEAINTDNESSLEYPGSWIERIWKWKKDYPSKDDPNWKWTKPYELMQELARYTTPQDIIVSDTGCALGWLMQGFPFNGERMIHAWNLTPMGYGLPAAVGAGFATGKRVVLITGDGSILMSLSELATIRRWNLNVKIILLNNNGMSMCKQTERQWFNGKHAATTPESGLGFPNFDGVADAFGLDLASNLEELFNNDDRHFLEVHIDEEAGLIPQARFGAPIEDSEPMLSREELKEQMMVPLMEVM